jgi:hypothetical protein
MARVNPHGYAYVLVSLRRVYKRLPIYLNLTQEMLNLKLQSAKDPTVMVVRQNNHKNMKISSTKRGKICKNRLGL